MIASTLKHTWLHERHTGAIRS